MEIIGRLTADAIVSETKTGKKVVNFSIAVNDNYKPKGSTEVQQVTNFFNCSYWLNETIAAYMKKGGLVEMQGRISVNAYLNKEGEAKATLNFHVNNLKLHGKPNGGNTEAATPPAITTTAQPVSTEDDLPF